MPACPKCHKGFVFYPEYGRSRCSNTLCDWNLFRKAGGMWGPALYDEDFVDTTCGVESL